MTGYGRTDDIECGVDGCSTENEACLPIRIPNDDPSFRDKECLEFVRSQEVPNINCTMGEYQVLTINVQNLTCDAIEHDWSSNVLSSHGNGRTCISNKHHIVDLGNRIKPTGRNRYRPYKFVQQAK